MYADTLLDHFEHPRNNGTLVNPDGEASSENPICGDRLTVQVRVTDGVVQELRWQGAGCPPALAAASVMSEMVIGRPLVEVLALDREHVTSALGGLPPRKTHAALLAVTALRAALRHWS